MAISRTGKLNKRATFKVKDGYEIGLNGMKVPKYIDKFTCWFAFRQKYINEIKVENTAYEDTTDIIIRQKQKEEVQPDWIVTIKNKDYDIVKINPDVEDEEFMVIVLKAVN